jgi:hypothetical protein
VVYFTVPMSQVLEASDLRPQYDPGAVFPDLERTQIPGKLYTPVNSQIESQESLLSTSEGTTDSETSSQTSESSLAESPRSASPTSEGSTDSEASSQTSESSLEPSREKFNQYFQDFFTPSQALIYNQGMLTGSIVDQIIINAYQSESDEKLIEFKDSTKAVSLCFAAEKGTWQGVHFRMNLNTKDWYAVVTDFSNSPPQVAIMGKGSYYDLLTNKLGAKKIQQSSGLNSFIKNEDVSKAIGQLPMLIDVAKQQKSSAQTTYSKCTSRFLVLCGCSEYAAYLGESNARKLQSLDETYESPKPAKPGILRYFGR